MYAIGDIAHMPTPQPKVSFLAGAQGEQAATNLIVDIEAIVAGKPASAGKKAKFSPAPVMGAAMLGRCVEPFCFFDFPRSQPLISMEIVYRKEAISYLPGLGTRLGIGKVIVRMIKGKDGGAKFFRTNLKSLKDLGEA